MRSAIAKELRSHFDTKLRQTFPQFAKSRNKAIPPGYSLYEWQAAPDFVCFLCLEIAPATDDDFTIEVAWSRKGRYPATVFNVGPNDKPKRRRKPDEMRFRLSGLWTKEDVWWELAQKISAEDMADAVIAGRGFGLEPVEVVVDRIPQHVAEAMLVIKQYALPYFDTIRTKG